MTAMWLQDSFHPEVAQWIGILEWVPQAKNSQCGSPLCSDRFENLCTRLGSLAGLRLGLEFSSLKGKIGLFSQFRPNFDYANLIR